MEIRASSTRSFGRSPLNRSRASRSLSRAGPVGRYRRMKSRWFSRGQRPARTPRITLITAEERPLGALGSAASDAVAAELELAGVETITGVELADAPARGTRPMTVADLIIVPERAEDEATALIGEPTDPARVQIGAGVAREFERLISLPVMLGPHVAGVARDHAGFIAVDESLKVCGSDVVWAAGGCIAGALEHSALSAQQADAAVAAITAACSHAGRRVGDRSRCSRDRRPSAHRAARPLVGREPDRDARALHPLSMVAPGTGGRQNAGPPNRRLGPVGARTASGPQQRAGDPSTRDAGVQRSARLRTHQR